jgi:hypothetical protein
MLTMSRDLTVFHPHARHVQRKHTIPTRITNGQASQDSVVRSDMHSREILCEDDPVTATYSVQSVFHSKSAGAEFIQKTHKGTHGENYH